MCSFLQLSRLFWSISSTYQELTAPASLVVSTALISMHAVTHNTDGVLLDGVSGTELLRGHHTIFLLYRFNQVCISFADILPKTYLLYRLRRSSCKAFTKNIKSWRLLQSRSCYHKATGISLMEWNEPSVLPEPHEARHLSFDQSFFLDSFFIFVKCHVKNVTFDLCAAILGKFQ